jgi:hypothetical protein
MVDNRPVLGNPTDFAESVRAWVQRIQAARAKPILYMTWARRVAPLDAAKMQQELATAYLAVGRELGVKVAPVGLAWAEARRRFRTLDLHIWDASHPTTAGSYLAGLVIYATITGRNPTGAPSVVFGRPTEGGGQNVAILADLRVPLVDLRDATALELQKTAWEIVSQTRD